MTEDARDDGKSKALVALDAKELIAQEARTLQERLDEVHLSEEEIDEIAQKHGAKALGKELLGLSKVGQIVKIFWEWNDKTNESIKKLKQDILLADYMNRHEDIEAAIQSLKRFISSPYGNVLFNKIVQIVDGTPPDPELSGHLAEVMKNIAASDFEAQFDDHRYALAQIETLTAQALSVLADYRSWPTFGPDGGIIQVSGKHLQSEWSKSFTSAYAAAKNMTDTKKIERLYHTVADLRRRGFAVAEATTNEAKAFLGKPSGVGQVVIAYLK